jgi:dihydrolipoamide dehydrogenase
MSKENIVKKKLLIIGAGPGGYVAAIRAAQMGGEVAIIEKEDVGGTCLHKGCVPTKCLLQSARIYREIQDTRKFGVYCSDWSYRFDKMVEAKGEIVRAQANGIRSLLRKHKIRLINGKARLLDPHTVEIEGAGRKAGKESADAIIISTGSEPLIPAFVPRLGDRVITTTEALNLDDVPKTIAIIGGSIAGCEFACLFTTLGSRVTVVEMLSTILPSEDEEISAFLASQMEKEGIEIICEARVNALEKEYPRGRVGVKFEGGGGIEADYCLLALGRRPCTDGLNLGEVGVRYSDRGIEVNERMETSIPNVYAVGDVTGTILLAHWASAQGIVAAENAMGHEVRLEGEGVPSCIWTHPEIGSVGVTENEARERGMDVRIGKMHFRSNSMANALRESEGFIKVVLDNGDGRIIGVHIIGTHASELIAEGTIAVRKGMTPDDMKTIIHAHPTLSETFQEAMLSASGLAIHAL